MGAGASEEDARESADLAEADTAVRGAGGGVEVVDVEGDHRGDVGEGVAQDRGHAGDGEALAAVFGGDPDALDLAGGGGGGADLGLEDDLAALVEAGEGAAGADQFGDPGLVEEAAVAGHRGDADLLGEHGHAGGHDRFHLVLADAADEGVGHAARDTGTPIRIGVNAGSLDARLLKKYGKATPEALVESALWEASLFEEHGFGDIKISVKHNDPVVMVNAYRQLAAQCDYPLHLGVTEAGPAFQGTIKSAVAFGALLSEGIGDTIRVSLSAPPVEEIKVGIQILESLNLRQRRLEIVSCPSCGRAQVDVYKLADQVSAGLEGMEVPLRVAVMGCVVNGPGEAREADLGVASGNGKGQIFVKGEVIKTVPESKIVETLIEEAMKIAEQMEADGVPSGEPTVAIGK